MHIRIFLNFFFILFYTIKVIGSAGKCSGMKIYRTGLHASKTSLYSSLAAMTKLKQKKKNLIIYK